MPKKISSSKNIGGFHGRMQACLRDTEPPIFCKLCGEIKKEFTTPERYRFFDGGYYSREPHVIVLKCRCEREIEMHKEFLENYRECETKSKTKYSDLIDGKSRPVSDDEKEIYKTGIQIRDRIKYAEIKLARQ